MVFHSLTDKIASVFRLLSKKSVTKTWTYYIPAPKERADRVQGHEEREFDRRLFHFLSQGCTLLHIHSSPHMGRVSSGLWVICTLRGPETVLCSSDLTAPLDAAAEIRLDDEFTVIHD